MGRLRFLCIALLAALACGGACAESSLANDAHARAHSAKRCKPLAKRHGRSRRRHSAVCPRRRKQATRRRRKALSHGKQVVSYSSGLYSSAPPAPTACANTQLQPSEGNLETVRTATLCLINRERTTRDERPLTLNVRLQTAAQGHTQSMVANDYFEHVGPNGETPLARMRACGYIGSSSAGYTIGENIAWGTLWLGTPSAIVAAWMASPGHRANILDAQYAETGIGVSPHPPSSLAHGQAGGIYTQDFGAITGG